MTYLNLKQQLKVGFLGWKVHLLQYKVAYIGLIILFVFLGINVSFGVNRTTSINKNFFIVLNYVKPDKGDYVVFKWHGKYYDHLQGKTLIKHLVGVPGDTLYAVGREVFLNNQSMGIAKERSSDGKTILNVNPGVAIPADRYYVKGDSLDSLDSRYEAVGFIDKNYIVGTAYALF